MTILNPVVFQGAVTLVHHSDNSQHGVVGAPTADTSTSPAFRQPYRALAMAWVPLTNWMRTRAASVPKICVNLIQLIPAQVVVAVAGGASKVGVGHPVVLERLQHPLGILLGDSVNAGKLLPQLGLGLLTQLTHLLANV